MFENVVLPGKLLVDAATSARYFQQRLWEIIFAKSERTGLYNYNMVDHIASSAHFTSSDGEWRLFSNVKQESLQKLWQFSLNQIEKWKRAITLGVLDAY